jgi:hypothetical protein
MKPAPSDGQPAPSEECLPGAADRFRLCTSPSERGTVWVRPSGLWCAAARLCNSSPPSPETLYCRFVCLLNSERPPLGAPAAIVHCLIKVRAVPAFQPAAFLQRVQKHKLGSARSARGFGSSAERLAVKIRCSAHAQTTNLGVRSSNLFGRAKRSTKIETSLYYRNPPCRMGKSAWHLHGKERGLLVSTRAPKRGTCGKNF